MNKAERTNDGNGLRVLALLIREGGTEKLWGSELSFLDLCNEMTRLGATVNAVESRPARLLSRRPLFPVFEVERRGFLPRRLLAYVIGTLRICRSTGSEVVYVHANYWLESVFTGLVVSLLARKRLYLGVLDTFKSGEDSRSLAGFLGLALKRRSVRTLLFGLARRISARRADACIVTNEEVARYATEVLRARRAVSISRGVSEIFFERGQRSLLYDACLVGRVARGKGVPELLDAWTAVCRSRPDALLALVGAGDELEEMQEIAAARGLEQNVRFLGYQKDPSALHDILESSRLFVFPTRREGFARAVSEAMASGVPCIVSDLPQLRSVYGEAVVYADQNDPRALASAILRLLGDPDELRRLSDAGTAFARRFTWERSARLLLETMGWKDQA